MSSVEQSTPGASVTRCDTCRIGVFEYHVTCIWPQVASKLQAIETGALAGGAQGASLSDWIGQAK